MGSTGSGKSTLVDVMLGLLNPTTGKIVIDNNELYQGNIREWQKNLSYVPQDIYLLDTSIRQNIALGLDKDEVDQELLMKCVDLSNLNDLIENELDEGLDTIVGERGVRLSGGQKQRIGIARALYQKPKIIFFDEATSSLDNITEQEIIASLEKLQGNITLIMIAHRVTTLKSCDKIIVLDKGKIIDSGSYEYLVDKNVLFSDILKSIKNNKLRNE